MLWKISCQNLNKVKDEGKLSDSSFEEILEESEPFNKVDFVVNELVENIENEENSLEKAVLSEEMLVDEDQLGRKDQETESETVKESESSSDNIRWGVFLIIPWKIFQ